jgi:hypothetical protein
MVDGRELPAPPLRCAWSFWELRGWKKACDVNDGTWLRLLELVGRELATLVAPMLPRFAARDVT